MDHYSFAKLDVKMIVKIHKSHDGKRVLAVCDSDIVGKKFEDDKMQLDLGYGFYKGEEKTEEELLEELKKPCSVNVAGNKSVKFFVDRGLINKGSVVKIGGISHAQCLLIGN